MWNPDVEVNRSRQAAMTETARTLGLTTIPVEVRGVDTLEQAFATMTKERAQAFVLQGDSVLHEYRGKIAEMAVRNRLPSAAVASDLAEAGFVLSYGADLLDLYRRAAGFVEKILKGAKSEDLPVEQSTNFATVTKLTTATAALTDVL